MKSKILIQMPGGGIHTLPGDTPYAKIGEYIATVEEVTHKTQPLKIEEEDNIPCDDMFDFLAGK